MPLPTAERRFVPQRLAPVVVTRDSGKPVISGYAAVFYRENDPGTEYEIFPGFVERIGRSAFDRALGEDDPRGLFNHNPDYILGRASAGTLKLSIDDKGLRYDIEPPDTQIGRDVITSIERGDLTGSSFAFYMRAAEWHEGRGDEPEVRVVTDVQLLDVGPVTYPAYEATSTGLRAEGNIEAALKEWTARREEKIMRLAEEARAATARERESLLVRARIAGL